MTHFYTVLVERAVRVIALMFAMSGFHGVMDPEAQIDRAKKYEAYINGASDAE